jgi:iron(II)-dependent oxidoreductase
MECVDVGAHPEGASAFDCRQMAGNLWEWTSSDFLPFPGFTPDPYKDYSRPLLGSTKTFRGGCWVTRSRLIRNNYRNYNARDRLDLWVEARICAAGRKPRKILD